MGALTIAFDITIVGALALPWVVLVIYLFCFEGEDRFGTLVKWIRSQSLEAFSALWPAAGVVLFAVAYTVGCAVSRVAQDFFNDDDLFVQINIPSSRVLRMAMTEDRIIARVLCDVDDDQLLPAQAGNRTPENPTLAEKVRVFQCQKTACCNPDEQSAAGLPKEKDNASPQTSNCCTEQDDDDSPGATNPSSAGPSSNSASSNKKPHCLCSRILDWKARYTRKIEYSQREDHLISTARDIFGLEENFLLLKGTDPSLRLRQLHDQTMVLRGAAFNGLIALSFCLFAWGVQARREGRRPPLRWALAAVPILPLFLALTAAIHHFSERSPTDPPYMEFSLLAIGVAGAVLLWRPARQSDAEKVKHGPRLHWPGPSMVAAVLTLAAMLGWWATEVAYGQEVIYSYDSQWLTAAKN